MQLSVEHFRSCEVPCNIHNEGVPLPCALSTKAWGSAHHLQSHWRTTNNYYLVPVCAFEGIALGVLSFGALVHLKERHPITDAVGELKDQEGKEWLLLIQVSLSTYKDHYSKAGDLCEAVTYLESVSAATDECNWLQYYRNLCGSDLKCMYVYVSP